MNEIVVFIVGSVVFALTVYGSVMAGGVALTRRFYEQNQSYVDRPGYEDAGVGAPDEDHPRHQ